MSRAMMRCNVCNGPESSLHDRNSAMLCLSCWEILCSVPPFVYFEYWVIIMQINFALTQYKQFHLSDCSTGFMLRSVDLTDLYQWSVIVKTFLSQHIQLSHYWINITAANKHNLLTYTGLFIVHPQVAIALSALDQYTMDEWHPSWKTIV